MKEVRDGGKLTVHFRKPMLCPEFCQIFEYELRAVFRQREKYKK